MAIEMIRKHVEQQSDVRMKLIDGFELKGADFDDQPIGNFRQHDGGGNRQAIVAAGHTHLPGARQSLSNPLHNGAFPVGAGDGDHGAVTARPSELKLRKQRNAANHQVLNPRML